MDVVWVIAKPIDTHWRVGVGQVFFVHRGRDFIVQQRIEIAADPIIDMARHVDEVPRVRNGPAQPIRIGLGTLWPIRRLDRMDVEMNGANMVWIVRQHALERRHD